MKRPLERRFPSSLSPHASQGKRLLEARTPSKQPDQPSRSQSTSTQHKSPAHQRRRENFAPAQGTSATICSLDYSHYGCTKIAGVWHASSKKCQSGSQVVGSPSHDLFLGLGQIGLFPFSPPPGGKEGGVTASALLYFKLKRQESLIDYMINSRLNRRNFASLRLVLLYAIDIQTAISWRSN